MGGFLNRFDLDQGSNQDSARASFKEKEASLQRTHNNVSPMREGMLTRIPVNI